MPDFLQEEDIFVQNDYPRNASFRHPDVLRRENDISRQAARDLGSFGGREQAGLVLTDYDLQDMFAREAGDKAGYEELVNRADILGGTDPFAPTVANSMEELAVNPRLARESSGRRDRLMAALPDLDPTATSSAAKSIMRTSEFLDPFNEAQEMNSIDPRVRAQMLEGPGIDPILSRKMVELEGKEAAAEVMVQAAESLNPGPRPEPYESKWWRLDGSAKEDSAATLEQWEKDYENYQKELMNAKATRDAIVAMRGVYDGGQEPVSANEFAPSQAPVGMVAPDDGLKIQTLRGELSGLGEEVAGEISGLSDGDLIKIAARFSGDPSPQDVLEAVRQHKRGVGNPGIFEPEPEAEGGGFLDGVGDFFNRIDWTPRYPGMG